MENSGHETKKITPNGTDHGLSYRRKIKHRLIVQVRSFAEAVAMGLAAVVAALTVNALRKDSLPLVRRAPFDIFTDCPEVSDHLPTITVARLGPDPKGVVFVDGRRAWNYCEGHIPRAVFLPMYETEEPDPATVRKLQRRKGHWIVVYADASVAGDKRLMSALISAGLRGLRLLEGGLDAWKHAGFPLEHCIVNRITPSTYSVDPERFLLVDPRPTDAFAKDHAPRTVNLPFDDVLPPEPDVLARLLASKKPILVIDTGTKLPDGTKTAWAVAAELKARGARNVSILMQHRQNHDPGDGTGPAETTHKSEGGRPPAHNGTQK